MNSGLGDDIDAVMDEEKQDTQQGGGKLIYIALTRWRSDEAHGMWHGSWVLDMK